MWLIIFVTVMSGYVIRQNHTLIMSAREPFNHFRGEVSSVLSVYESNFLMLVILIFRKYPTI